MFLSKGPQKSEKEDHHPQIQTDGTVLIFIFFISDKNEQ